MLGLGLLAAGVSGSHAQAPTAPAADNGIVGIAIGLTADTVGAPARLVVERVLPSGPAHAAGVRRGDEITAIDGQSVNGKSLRDVVHMVRGKVGSTVTLTLSHEGATHDVSLKREEAPPHPNRKPW
jgi:C-terminal processing protease CtpA/Prc